MNETTLYPNWQDQVVYGSDGPQPHILMANEKVKALMAGLRTWRKNTGTRRSPSLVSFSGRHRLDDRRW